MKEEFRLLSKRVGRLGWGGALCLTVAGCTGELTDGGPGGNSNGRPNSPNEPGSPGNPNTVDPSDPNAVGAMPLERLNRTEYNNTVRDLLGSSLTPADEFPRDVGGSAFPVAGVVSVLDARNLRGAAEELAAEADIAALVPCDEMAVGERECAAQFIETFGARAFRRPVLGAEQERLLELYDAASSDPLALGFDDAARLLLEAMLQSPAFLYHWELGPQQAEADGEFLRLNSYEVASRLSYFLHQTMPDDELLAAAAANQLADVEAVEEHARRLLKDPKAEAAVASFFEFWIGVSEIEGRSKSIEEYPQFDDELKLAMLEETRRFSRQVLFGDGADFTSLFSGVDSFANEPLADIYGLSGVSGATFAPISHDSSQRQGLLTQAAFLAETGGAEGSNPTRRGAAVLDRILCLELPDPPNEIPAPAPASEGGTTRDRFAQHADQPCARACHNLLDPIGYAFEHFDGIGQYRDLDNGLPVDASGSVSLGGEDRVFEGAVELSNLLAESSEAKECFASHWMHYGLRRENLRLDQPSLMAATQSLLDGGDILDMIVTVATSRSFRYRVAAVGETQP